MTFEGSCGANTGTRSAPTPPPAPVMCTAKSSASSPSSPPPQQQQQQQQSSSAAPANRNAAVSKALLLAQMLLCVVGINVCFGWWSVKQERLITKPYFIEDAALAAATAAAARGHGIHHTSAAAAAAAAPAGRPHAVYISTVYGFSLAQAVAGVVVSAPLLGAMALLRRRQTPPRPPQEEQQRRGRARHGGRGGDAAGLARQSGGGGRRDAAVVGWRDVCEMLSVGFSNVFGSSLGYAAMRRLSYPVALTSKMGKMLPVMLVGFAWYKTRYPAKKVASCLLITVGIVAFFVLENRATTNAATASTSRSGASSSTTSSSSALGMALLLLNLMMDGYTNATQDVLVRRHSWSGATLMLWTNMASATCALAVLAALEVGERPWSSLTAYWHDHTTTTTTAAAAAAAARSVVPFHDLSNFFTLLAHCPEACHDVLLMSLLNAVGQLFIFHTISVFGTLALTAMTLLRKVGSVLLSIAVHGHHVQPAQWASLGAVLIGVVGEGYVNIQEASLRQSRAAAATSSSSSSGSSNGRAARRRGAGGDAGAAGKTLHRESSTTPQPSLSPAAPSMKVKKTQ
ncbi:UDP-galactose transporter [Novymonas esmeraldas]|uniref:UDP-galactose transporter n=1 Tax=Novymonas esmeraldas TaxID=1808958 RepID=A0AAW0EQA6_9TRYP